MDDSLNAQLYGDDVAPAEILHGRVAVPPEFVPLYEAIDGLAAEAQASAIGDQSCVVVSRQLVALSWPSAGRQLLPLLPLLPLLLPWLCCSAPAVHPPQQALTRHMGHGTCWCGNFDFLIEAWQPTQQQCCCPMQAMSMQ